MTKSRAELETESNDIICKLWWGLTPNTPACEKALLEHSRSDTKKGRFSKFFEDQEARTTRHTGDSSPALETHDLHNNSASIVFYSGVAVVTAIVAWWIVQQSMKNLEHLQFRKWLIAYCAWLSSWIFLGLVLDDLMYGIRLGFLSLETTLNTLAIAVVPPIIAGATWRAWRWASR